MKEFVIGLWFIFRLIINTMLYRCFNLILFTLPYLKNTRAYSKQIFWECGGGYAPYYMGIGQAIYETYPKEVLDNIVWSGSSSGVWSAMLMNNSHQPSMFFQYCKTNVLLPLFKQPLGGFYNIKNKVKNTIWNEYFIKFHSQYLNNNERLFIAYFNLNILFPFLSHFVFAYNFETNTDIINSALASHDIPFVSGLTVKHHINPFILRFDGGWVSALIGNLLNYDLFMPYGKNIKSSSIRFDTFRPLQPFWLWLWTDPIHNQNMFDLGYKDAINNKILLDTIIN